jgi:hypothetical protein
MNKVRLEKNKYVYEIIIPPIRVQRTDEKMRELIRLYNSTEK